MRCRASLSRPAKRPETMVSRKWLPPALAPSCPAWRLDSSRSSTDWGSRAPRRLRISASRFIRQGPYRVGRPGSRGFFLYVARQEQRLHDHEREHQSHAAEELEVDPGIRREIVGDVEVDRAHDGKEADPAPVEPPPRGVGHLHLLSEHRPYQVAAREYLGAGDCPRKQPVEHRGFPFDESLVVQDERRAAEHHDDGEADPHHGLDLALSQLEPAYLEERRDDRDRRCGIDAEKLEGDEKQCDREEVEQEFHGTGPALSPSSPASAPPS